MLKGILIQSQANRFLVCGALAAMVNWLVRFPLSLFMPFPAAVATATAIGMAFGFVLYRRFVFVDSDRSVGHQLRDFLIVNLFSIVVVTAVATAIAAAVMSLTEFRSNVEAAAHFVGIGVGALTNFFGHKWVTFRRS
jgi:putative flippase GtrA